MRKLLSANFYRLRNDSAFFGILLIAALTGSALVIMDAKYLDGGAFLNSGVEIGLCGAFPFAQLFSAAAISLYLGKEYDWGGFRQKLSCGTQWHHVYAANQITATVLSAVILACYLLTAAGAGSFLYNGSAWTTKQFLFVLLCCFCVNAAYAAIYTAISMNIPSRTISLISTIGCYFLLRYTAEFVNRGLHQEPSLADFIDFSSSGEPLFGPEYPNSDYIGGSARKLLTFLYHCLPSGQAMEMDYLSTSGDWTTGITAYWPVFSIVLLGIVSVLGYSLFRNKDIR